MKKLYILSLFLLLLTGCGKSNKADTLPEEEQKEESIKTDSITDIAHRYYLTADSIGPLHVGISLDSIPLEVKGLYNSVAVNDESLPVTIIFSQNEEIVMAGYEFEDGHLDLLTLDSDKIKVKSPQGDMAIGEDFKKVLTLPEVEPVWIDFDSGGTWYWTWEGLWFAPSYEGLSYELLRALHDSENEPGKEFFKDDVRIGFIGTGLPF